jgi:hypothetical protein
LKESSEQNRSAESRSHPPTSEAGIWRDLAYQFQQLVSKEQEVVQATGRPGLYLDACFYDHAEAPESDVWKLIGMDEGFRVQFRALAKRGGMALNPPKGISPRDFWLHRLYQYLREEYKDLPDERSHAAPDGSVVTQLYDEDGGERRYFGLLKTNGCYLFEASNQQGGIRHVCQASAIFCSWLEEQAPQTSTAVEPLQQKAPAPRLKQRAGAESKQRANCVEQVLRELKKIRPKMVNESHYNRVERDNPKFKVFQVANQHPTVRTWVENVQNRRDMVALAQEITAQHYTVAPSTVAADWSHRHSAKQMRRKK